MAPVKKVIQGRSDLTKVFEWLKMNSVTKIVKVIVLDDQDPCHADASIEDALKGFDVEIWDWKRLDLSTEVIRKSTRVVREISLYSSGNNSVLMGWASEDGLPNEQYFPKGFEHPERLLGYIDEFKLKIQSRSKGRIAVSAVRDDRLGSYALEFQSRVGGSLSESPWIHCMLRLSKFLKEPCEKAKIKPIKVAIIDDGVDVSLSSLQDKIALGQSFCPYPNSTDMMSPYFMSSSNHGTSMATLICSLCPMVRLYVARLDQRQTLGGSQRHITVDSAAQAIQWATDCGVDIISMSWTIETTVSGNLEVESLQKAIQRASAKRIIMFCSTSDQGSMTSEHRCYPGDFDGCIKIGSASNTGDAMAYVKVGSVDFLLPGSNVPFSITEGKTNLHESGSSIATAAASGLAAFLMSSSRLVNDNVDFFKDYGNMKTAFQNLSQSNKFPAVNERLEKLFIQTLERIRKNGRKKESQGEIQEQKKLRDLPVEWSAQCQEALSSVMFGITNTN
ncbi:hypothetical protein BFJ70_g8007 [Fusarium oxysporum]|nr:hypothetical protein BFJ70_g8007 [Fusarium oxysporum]